MFRRGHMYFLVSDLCLRVHLSISEYNVNKTKTRPKPPKQYHQVRVNILHGKQFSDVRKNPNNTRLPEYLRPVNGPKSAPVAKGSGLVTFLQWFHDNDSAIELNKMSPATLAAFGLGWYISDTLTRDEKQSWQKNLDDEFSRSVEREEASNRMSRSGKKMKKSAYDELQEHYRERMK